MTIDELQDEIGLLTAELKESLAENEHIDIAKLSRLFDLRQTQYLQETQRRERRFLEMRTHTRALINRVPKLSSVDQKLFSAEVDQMIDLYDKYDRAAIKWVNATDESDWADSEAASIADHISIIANEIRR